MGRGPEESKEEALHLPSIAKLCPPGSWPSSAPAGHLPLALAGMQDELRVVPGTDCQLVLCGVEDVEEQVALSGAAWKDGGGFRTLQRQREAT